MKVKYREAIVTLEENEARLIRMILGQFTIETCRELYEGAEDMFAKIDIHDADDLDRATDKLFTPLSEIFPEDTP